MHACVDMYMTCVSHVAMAAMDYEMVNEVLTFTSEEVSIDVEVVTSEDMMGEDTEMFSLILSSNFTTVTLSPDTAIVTISECVHVEYMWSNMWNACGMHVECMWSTCGMHVECMWNACGVHVECMWKCMWSTCDDYM